MTPSPHTIEQDQSLSAGYRMLRKHGIRHLPVLHGGKLVGILSQRDLHFLATLRDVDPDRLAVSEAMTLDTYAVGPKSTLRKVAGEMAAHRYGSAVVIDNDLVVGILTTVDALGALEIVLTERLAAAG
jgi:acetoin utilization protein AcuB